MCIRDSPYTVERRCSVDLATLYPHSRHSPGRGIVAMPHAAYPPQLRHGDAAPRSEPSRPNATAGARRYFHDTPLLQVSQQDLQHQFHAARQRAAEPHAIPFFQLPEILRRQACPESVTLWRQHITYWRCIAVQLGDERTRRKLHRLDRASSPSSGTRSPPRGRKLTTD